MEPTTVETLLLYGFTVDSENQPESGTIYERDGFRVSDVEDRGEFVYEGGGGNRIDVSSIEDLLATWKEINGYELKIKL